MTPTTSNTPRGERKKGAEQRSGEVRDAYAKINQEMASLLTDKERIVFGPVKDFEYKAPLEDFQRSQSKKVS